MKLSQTLFLASKSPRRRELLNAAHIPYELLDVDVAEIYPETMDVFQVPVFLAELKAKGARKIKSEDIILTADTIVIQDGQILGKPKDTEDAKITLRKLAGRKHTVVTGVCISTPEKMSSFSSISHVKLHELNDAEIDFYINTYKPFDKAGSYGIQDWIGWVKIASIEGSYANVMGLPIDLIYRHLNTLK